MSESSPQNNLRLSIQGMSCAGCVAAVEKALTKVDGVEQAEVSFAEHSALVIGDVGVATLIGAVREAGYDAAEMKTLQEEQHERAERNELDYRDHIKRSWVAGLLGFPLMALGMAGYLPELAGGRGFWLLAGLLTLGVMLYSGGQHYVGAWKQFRHHNANMDTLIAVGTAAAWLYSMGMVLFPHSLSSLAAHAYFEAAAIILCLINFGAALEVKAKGRTSAAIQRLIGLQPDTVRVLREGKERDIPLLELGLGETVRVRPGERVAVDGEIIEGSSWLDESMISGEPIPVARGMGDEVIGGTMNTEGSFLFKTTRIGQDTVLARIIEMVRNAQGSKPHIGRLVDKVAGVFVPVILIIAVLTFLVWMNFGPEPVLAYAVVATMSVLIIACPCALGLATPISIMVGVGKAAELGVLIRNGEALQQAGRLQAIVLDKTGTVTEGRPSLVDMEVRGPLADRDNLLQIAATVEAGSEHPIARAIVRAADEKDLERLEVTDFRTESGHGVEAMMGGQRILLGSRRWMERHQIKMGDLQELEEQWAAQGRVVIYLAVNELAAAVLAVSDPLKEDSAVAVERLQKLGMEVVMLTGDQSLTAHAIARELGIERVIAEVLPEQKEQTIARMQEAGTLVAMVGDGINDAPALARADVGFAIGGGTDVAIESADITLMRNSLHGVADAIEVSRLTVRNIKQNLWGAFFYNSLGVPVAAGVLFPFSGLLLNPMVAGAAMALSSVTVVSNANRLRLFKPRRSQA